MRSVLLFIVVLGSRAEVMAKDFAEMNQHEMNVEAR